MNLKEYEKETQRTFAYKEDESLNLLHCAIGASTEAGELLDAFKKSIYYNKPLDLVNVGEEIADIMWYLSNLARLLNLDIEKLLDNNIAKLRVRFPEKFTSELATSRDLESERVELEKNFKNNNNIFSEDFRLKLTVLPVDILNKLIANTIDAGKLNCSKLAECFTWRLSKEGTVYWVKVNEKYNL